MNTKKQIFTKEQNEKANKLSLKKLNKLSPREYDKYLLESGCVTKDQLNYIKQDNVSCKETLISHLMEADETIDKEKDSHEDFIDSCVFKDTLGDQYESNVPTSISADDSSTIQGTLKDTVYDLLRGISLCPPQKQMFDELYVKGTDRNAYMNKMNMSPDNFCNRKKRLDIKLREFVLSKLKKGFEWTKDQVEILNEICPIAGMQEALARFGTEVPNSWGKPILRKKAADLSPE